MITKLYFGRDSQEIFKLFKLREGDGEASCLGLLAVSLQLPGCELLWPWRWQRCGTDDSTHRHLVVTHRAGAGWDEEAGRYTCRDYNASMAPFSSQQLVIKFCMCGTLLFVTSSDNAHSKPSSTLVNLGKLSYNWLLIAKCECLIEGQIARLTRL